MDDHSRRASTATSAPAIVTGPRSPLQGTPQRPASSVRRTTSVDGMWVDAGLVLEAKGRDLITDHERRPGYLVEQSVRVATGPDMTVASLVATPPVEGLEPLMGLPLRGSLRRTLASMPMLREERSNLVRMLLDDIVAAALISGYARQRNLDAAIPVGAFVEHMSDICAGWGAEGQMARTSRTTGRVPLVIGPVAPPLQERNDPLAWHELAPPAEGTVRRVRRTDVVCTQDGSTAWITAMFRDSHQEEDGTPTILHEYWLTASADLASGRLIALQADPRVLPAAECPSAAASVSLMAGVPLVELRQRVRQDLRGTRTCTHLNDMLRSLADVPDLLASLEAPLARDAAS